MAKVIATYVTLRHVLDDGSVVEQNLKVDEAQIRQCRRVGQTPGGTLEADPFSHFSVSGFVKDSNTKH